MLTIKDHFNKNLIGKSLLKICFRNLLPSKHRFSNNYNIDLKPLKRN